jgi:DNA processing protein
MRLLARFGSAEAVLHAPESELSAPSLRLKPEQIQAIMTDACERREGIEEEFVALGDAGIEVICGFEPAYPGPLRDARTPPPVICVRGTLRPEDTHGLAIVGTREPTDEGCRVAADVAVACARRELTVVSGLAIGVDTCAHRGALKGGGRTVAVLGSGIRTVHPQSNRRLATRIASNGAIVSEFPPDARPNAARLMARNRLTAALARGVLAVESTLTGGTLRTAYEAWEQWRVVFACDWQSERPQAQGTGLLIAEGAEPILGAGAIETIAHLLETHRPPPPEQPSLL